MYITNSQLAPCCVHFLFCSIHSILLGLKWHVSPTYRVSSSKLSCLSPLTFSAELKYDWVEGRWVGEEVVGNQVDVISYYQGRARKR